MARRHFEQILEELEIGNFPGYPRWYSYPNPMFNPLPDMYHNFRNSGRFNRFDIPLMDYYRQSYWMPQGFVFPNFEPFAFLRRNDKRNFHSKGHNFSRDLRNGEKRFYPNRQDGNGSYRIDRAKNDFLPFERHFQPNWNREANAQHYQLPRDNKNSSRLPYRHSNMNAEDIIIDQHLHNFKQMFENRNPSSECLTVNEAANRNGNDVNEHGMLVSSTVDWKEQCNKIYNNNFSNDTQYAVPSNFNNSYESWYCPEEQQQIVDMLKEVDFRHERQLKRDILLSQIEQSCSGGSMSSVNESQITDKSSQSSDEDEDDIHIILYPETIPPIPEEVKGEGKLESEYHEKSASDFFEEFQNIFTGSPEKKIINNMTKEMKKPLNQQDKEFEFSGNVITDDDKNAVKTVLDFENVEELSEKAFGENSITSSSPKESSNDISPAKNTVWSSETKPSCINVFSENGGSNEIIETLKVSKSHDNSSEANSNAVKETSLVTNTPAICSTQSVTNTSNNSKSPIVSRTPPSQLLSNKYGNFQYANENWKNYKNKKVSQTSTDSTKTMKTLNKIFQAAEKTYESRLSSGTPTSQSKNDQAKTPPTNTYFQLSNSARKEKNMSISEPSLIPKSKDVIYKRISISEIFNSVNVEPWEKLKGDSKYPIQHTIDQSMDIGHLSPTEHLKQILGIGKSERDKNSISNVSHFLNEKQRKVFSSGNHISNQSKPTDCLKSKLATAKKKQNVSQLPKASIPSEYSCNTSINSKEKKEKLLDGDETHCKTALGDIRFQNSKNYNRCSNKLISRHSAMEAKSNSLKSESTNSLSNETNYKTTNDRNSKNENYTRSFKRDTPNENQPKKQLFTQNRESHKEKYFEKNKVNQSRRGESNSGPQNSDEYERKDWFQKGRSVNFKKIESSGENLKFSEHKKSLKENKLCKPMDSQTTVSEEKTLEEPIGANKTESTKGKKKYKKKRKQKLQEENDDKTAKSKSSDDNDNKRVKSKPVDNDDSDKLNSKSSHDNNIANTLSNGDNYDSKIKLGSVKEKCDKVMPKLADDCKYCSRKNTTVNNNSDAYLKNNCKRTFLVTKKDNMHGASKDPSDSRHVNSHVSNSENPELIAPLENKESHQGNSKLRSFTSNANNRNSLWDPSTKDLKLQTDTEINNGEMRYHSSYRNYSKMTDNCYKKYNSYKTSQYRDGNGYWKGKRYNNAYPYSEKDMRFRRPSYQENECGRELKNYTDNKKNSDIENVSKKSNCSFRRNAQSAVTDNLQTSDKKNSPKKCASASEPKIPPPIPQLAKEIYQNISAPKKENRNFKCDHRLVFYFNVLNSCPIDPFLTSEIKCKIQQVIQKIEKNVYLLEKQETTDSSKEYRREKSNDFSSFLVEKYNFVSKVLKNYSCEYPVSYKLLMNSRNDLNSSKFVESLITCALQKLNEANCIALNSRHFNDICKDSYKMKNWVAFILLKFCMKIILKKNSADALEDGIFLVPPNIIDNYFRNRRVLELNPDLDVHFQMQLRDILCNLHSGLLSRDLQKRLHSHLSTVMERNLLLVTPLLLNFLSLLSTLHLSWTRNNLKELLDLNPSIEKKGNCKLLKRDEGKKSDNYISNVLKCWDILFNTFPDKKP